MAHRSIDLALFYLCCFIGISDVLSQYNGKEIGAFGSGTQHSVAGTIYAVDSNTIRIIGFSYDGSAPDAFIWGGESGSTPTSSGFEIGGSEKLGRYENQDIEVDLPNGKTVASLTWISIWCRAFTADFGHVDVPANFEAPAEVNLGALGANPRQHDVSATSVIIVNRKQIRFENLDYDGTAPDAFFWAGSGDTPRTSGHIVPDGQGSEDRIENMLSGVTITVTLPGQETVFDIGYIGLWCRMFTADFGHVDIPPQSQLMNIPPAPLGSNVMPEPDFPNCATLVDGELQVSWRIEGSDVILQLRSVGSGTEKYVAFGLSGSPTSTEMRGGDVVVTYVDVGGQAQVVDYYLGSRSQCTPQNGQGACPDQMASNTAANDVTLVDFLVENGITSITYSRPLAATDATYDKEITLTGPIYVIWARGSLNPSGTVAYHNAERSPGSSNLQINFGQANSTCPPLTQGVTETPPMGGWTIPRLVARDDATIVVDMGLSGGRPGYEFITGRVGWGIAWFMNDTLIPELVVERGMTYRFLVSGGNDSMVSASYHPFYITDEADGGYEQLSNAEKQNVRIFAGPVEGPLCQWKISDTTQAPENYDTFDDYRETLMKDCQPGGPAELVWTVAEDTPDLVYYQCYTHRFLGWRIRVLNAGDPLPTDPPMTTKDGTGGASSISFSFSLAIALLVVALMLPRNV